LPGLVAPKLLQFETSHYQLSIITCFLFLFFFFEAKTVFSVFFKEEGIYLPTILSIFFK